MTTSRVYGSLTVALVVLLLGGADRGRAATVPPAGCRAGEVSRW